MNCWTVLDLPDDADERTIRRRYAQLLKVHRPDEDPVAFQRLREAYERALQLARWRAEQVQDEREELPSVDSASTGLAIETIELPLRGGTQQDAGLPAPLKLHTPPQRIPLERPADSPEQGEPVDLLVEPPELAGAAADWSQDAQLPEPLALQTPPLQHLSLATAAPEVAEQAPARWFADASASELEAALAEAEAATQRELFERELLRECLTDRRDAQTLTRWALQRLHWFELGQRSELPLLAMNALAARLTDNAIDELAGDLKAGQERMFLECLRMLLATGWLQGFDRRAQFQQALAQLLLETPGWSDALFGAVCDACGWGEGNFADLWQWQALVRRAEQVAYERRLRSFLESSRPVDSEQKAAWLLLKPMQAGERERFKLSLTAEDWAAYGLLCDTLRYRYAELWDAWGCGEPEEPDDIAPARDGWRYTSVAFFLLLLVGLLIQGSGRGAFDDNLAEVIPLAIVAAMASAFLAWVMRGWGWLSDALVRVDVMLSRWVLLDTWVDGRRGLLLIRHLLPCAALAFLFAGASDLTREKTAVLWLLLFVGSGFYSLLAVRGYSLMEIGLALLIQGLSGTLGKVLLVLVVVAALATLAIHQTERAPIGVSPEPAAEPACADESCQRWAAVKGSLLELARAKRAAEEEARQREAGAAPQSRF